MVDIRVSRTFRFGNRRIVPQFDIFNITNADTVVEPAERRGRHLPESARDPVAAHHSSGVQSRFLDSRGSRAVGRWGG